MKIHSLLSVPIVLFSISVATAQPLSAQTPTFIISDTSKATWGPSVDDNKTFGTPPQPVLTSYRAEIFLRSAVTNGVPVGSPAITLDFGKPALDSSGNQSSPPLKTFSQIQPNTEYIMFMTAVGPGGVSPTRSPSSLPFGFPSTPKAVTSAVTFTP
jgi:hypothetical protein